MAHTVGTWMELTACNCELSFTCTGGKKRVFWQAWLLSLYVIQSLCHHICNVACLQSVCSQIQSKFYIYIYIGKEKHQYVVIWLYQEYAYSGGSHTFTGGLLLSTCTSMLPKEWQAKYCGFQWWLFQPSEYMAMSLSFGCSDGMIFH